MIITVSGAIGTGTTTLAKKLSEALNIPYFHAGAIFRELAAQKGVPLIDIIAASEHDLSIDEHVESELLKLMHTHPDMVVEGRLTSYQAWSNAIPSFRILLTASTETRVQRISDREKADHEKAMHEVEYRDTQDWLRYNKLYGITADQQSTWNTLVINTDTLGIEETLQTCLKEIQSS